MSIPTHTASQSEAIAKRYGLEAVPESVRRLGQMVSRPDATTEEIARLIGQDKDFTARLLRAANPRATDPEDYTTTTVEDALQRTGMGMALLLAMHDPLLRAVTKTFHTMAGLDLQAVAVPVVPGGERVVCEIAFAGKATGSAALSLTRPNAFQIASQMLGTPPDELGDESESVIDDVIGELGNMVVGNFKSNLCDAGLDCKLAPPVIKRTSNHKTLATPGGLSERIGFNAPNFELMADLNVNPWDD